MAGHALANFTTPYWEGVMMCTLHFRGWFVMSVVVWLLPARRRTCKQSP